MDEWIAEAVGRMHVHGITGRDIAKQMGVSVQWVSYLLNGKRKQKNAEERINKAIDELIDQKG